ncbi:MAG: hypothetical protein DYH08_10255 [Actinobacteria bacterium ATB1]|nr:hypothetical protein [Actinobacteria bacterium ATB1]
MADTTREPSGWAIGWSAFAAVILMLIGVFQFFAGLVAIVDDKFYVVTKEYIFQFDATTWGWIHLIIGIIVFFAGIFIFTGAVWARLVGVIIAALSAIAAFFWLPWYPIWAIIVIAIDIFVIWALTVHGRDIAEDY